MAERTVGMAPLGPVGEAAVPSAAETNLGAMLRCFMAMERWSMRRLGPEIGVSAATLHRICAGNEMDAKTLVKILNWMMRGRNG